MVQSDKALQVQIRQLETLLKKPENSTCADCPGKTPRWASITFGTFVCLRCSGQHRALGVHITKIKSVNLDKWPEGKVEAFQAMNNNLVNAYWEANLPKNFQKPASNASTSEVTRFLNEKYVEKRYVDTDMKYDPLYLWTNKRSRFDKFVKRCMTRAGVAVSEDEDEEDEDERPKKKSKKSSRTTGKVSKAPSKTTLTQAAAAAPAKPIQPQVQQPAPDLISLTPASNDQFGDFISPAAAAPQQDDGFGDFTGGAGPANAGQMAQPQQPPNANNQQQDMINKLLGVMNSNPQAHPSNTKYAAFEVMPDWNNQQQQQQARIQQMQMMQNQQQNMNNMMQPQQQQQQVPGAGQGTFQPQFFASQLQQQQQNYSMTGQFNMMGQQAQAQNNQANQWSATFNTGSGGNQQQQQPSPFAPQQPTQMNNGGFVGNMPGAGFGAANNGFQPPQQQQQAPNMFAGLQQQPAQSMNFGGGAPAASNGGAGGFGGFQSGPSQQAASTGQYYGGLVDLSAKGNTPGSNSGGGFNDASQKSQSQAQQNASFGNLVNW